MFRTRFNSSNQLMMNAFFSTAVVARGVEEDSTWEGVDSTTNQVISHTESFSATHVRWMTYFDYISDLNHTGSRQLDSWWCTTQIIFSRWAASAECNFSSATSQHGDWTRTGTWACADKEGNVAHKTAHFCNLWVLHEYTRHILLCLKGY